jgi:hypothetical protein
MSMSSTFFDDLADVYASLQSHEPALSSTFLSDLAQVVSILPVALGIDFEFLASRFDTWHAWAQAKMLSYDKNLSPDDPLHCPISLFRTMGYGRLETAHTRTLAWLLNPLAEHGFGDVLLVTLIRHLISPNLFDTLNAERVISEYPIFAFGKKGRSDVFAEGTWQEHGKVVRWVMIIEAKVDAWEGESQLAMYENWLSTEHRWDEEIRVFLTPYEGRVAVSGNEEWTPLSYPALVRAFRPAYAKLHDAPGFHFLRFYLAGVLQDICGWRWKTTADTNDPYAVLDYLK